MPATPGGTSAALEHEVLVAARPETVFSYFTDPAKMVAWMGEEATLDPRPGGVCRVGFTQPGATAAVGEFVEVTPYTRVVFTWGWEAEFLQVPPASTLVEVSLAPEADGTRVRLAHHRLPEATLPFHRAGWAHYLGRLALAATGHDPGADPRPDDMLGLIPGA